MDKNEYPTEDELQEIREWNYLDFEGLMEYVKELWHWSEFIIQNEQNEYLFHTGGWSGNEEIIQAMQDNVMFWSLYWKQSTRGGHYIFENQKFS